MKATDIIDELRSIRRAAQGKRTRCPFTGRMQTTYGTTRSQTLRRIEALEDQIAGRAVEDFAVCPVVGFDTLLSFIAKVNPESLGLIDEPVHGTISEGMQIAKTARQRGLPVIKVETCAHMKRRFPKAVYVNAYPTAFLAEVLGYDDAST